jgi:hypothetical protein
MFISAMDMTIANVALPDMSNDLDAGIGELQWVLDAFLVSLAGLVLVGSGLADRFGRRRVFLSGFVGFAAASVLTAASQMVGEVIAARVLMGVAASCVLPPALSLLAVLFPPELRPRALGIWSAVAGLGLALGPVAGGVLVGQVCLRDTYGGELRLVVRPAARAAQNDVVYAHPGHADDEGLAAVAAVQRQANPVRVLAPKEDELWVPAVRNDDRATAVRGLRDVGQPDVSHVTRHGGPSLGLGAA